jgi:hypothetical protein
MTSKERVLQRERDRGRMAARELQTRAPEMTGTQLIAEEGKVPAWDPAKDYSTWAAGYPVADEGQVWILLQPHNAAHYTGRPSTLRALWGLAHTTDPAMAKPWVASYGTSGLYMIDEVCTHPHAGSGKLHVWRNKHDGNEYPPQTQGAESRWVDMGLA